MGISRAKQYLLFIISILLLTMISIFYIKGKVTFEYTYPIYTALSYYGVDKFNIWGKSDLLLMFPLCLRVFLTYCVISHFLLQRNIKLRGIECQRFLTTTRYFFYYMRQFLYNAIFACVVLVILDFMIKVFYFHNFNMLQIKLLLTYMNICMLCLFVAILVFLISHYINEIYALYAGYLIVAFIIIFDIKDPFISFVHDTNVKMLMHGSICLVCMCVGISIISLFVLKRADLLGGDFYDRGS